MDLEPPRNHHRLSKVRAIGKLVQSAWETPTIKSFLLSIEGIFDDPQLNPSFIPLQESQLAAVERRRDEISRSMAFRPGQWVDFFVPHIDFVGGFSITSTPRQLQKDLTIELAIKKAHVNPVVRWLHEESRLGDRVQVRIGGNFVLHEPDQPADPAVVTTRIPPNILLIAGGVGATPIISMATHIVDTNTAQPPSHPPKLNAVMLYSSRHASELLFSDRLAALAARPNSGLKLHFFVSQRGPPRLHESTEEERQRWEAAHADKPPPEHCRFGHIDRDAIAQQLEEMERETGTRPFVYMCGPPSMEQDVVGILNDLQFPSSHLFFEKWW
ncbi:Oxidoreductase NAD-binding domain-containing protein 1 [Phlyctochytrium bullatum]|nr:Oxidoreductase NAD-binding domain-containing protein 1 [Phlyctochytrium bullatum]